MSTLIHICTPNAVTFKQMWDCPVCKSEQVTIFRSYLWYGWRKTCTNCGDSWNDGEREERPFARYWRRDAIAAAQAEAATITTEIIPRGELPQWVRDMLHKQLADDMPEVKP